MSLSKVILTFAIVVSSLQAQATPEEDVVALLGDMVERGTNPELLSKTVHLKFSIEHITLMGEDWRKTFPRLVECEVNAQDYLQIRNANLSSAAQVASRDGNLQMMMQSMEMCLSAKTAYF